ncbi:hypothetical protein [Cohnella thermotolerans]|uniref:hypothetical protein n=1 Tax=Cohnella thermotolerans TaxID=329858 RepID=UPI0004013728|nr:hypothetical protein [Cohnella thermotolerans]
MNDNAEYLLPTVYASFHPDVAAYAKGIGGEEEGVFGFLLEASAGRASIRRTTASSIGVTSS